MTQNIHCPGLNAVKAEYFNWLCEMVHIDSHECWNMAKDLHSIEFTWSIPMDENRAMDGVELREDFFRDNLHIDSGYLDYMDEPCSVLEMFIALAKRINFLMDDPYEYRSRVSDYFWEIVHNLSLDEYTDDVYYSCNGNYDLNLIIDCLLNREYEWNGVGGMFPLRHTVSDQTEVEIWSQMQEYLEENYPV